MLSHITTVAILSIALSAQASPTIARRQDASGFCPQLLQTCAASPNAITDPWSVEACIFGATCFGGQRPVDDFLAALASAKGVSPVPASRNVPRVSQATFNKISTDGKVITQQNFIDGVYGTLSPSNGPFPDVSLVIGDYQRVTTWTAFCNGQGVPFMNFADYYQFSATVNSNGCSSATSTVPASTPTATPTAISGEATCNKMFTTCVAQVNAAVSDAWSHPACLFAATCTGGQRPVDTLLAVAFESKTGNGIGPPTSLQETRLSTATMKTISTDGSTITLQNWIDAYYGLLSSVGGPFPTDASVVISDFSRVQAWTGFCTGGIPFMNVADYFEFSASVSSTTAC